ncbi:hypothetical protein ACFYV7_39210 [Nocardia suismassiliense]|uniref:Uncharacterized protein n=1 Tax=Nocardia suismassiliense TaxID=2077092 RepID=A0ABW6R5R8_9NOCA
MTTLLESGYQIAAALGPGWRADRGYMVRAHVVLHGPSDQVLSILHGDDSHRRTDHGRLQIRPDYRDLARHLNSGEGSNMITVSADRAPTAIAAEITRRLLPDYTTTLGLCRTRAHADAQRQAKHQSTRDALFQVLQPARLVYDDRVYFGDSEDGLRGNIRLLRGGTAEFELTVSNAQALGLAHAIATQRASGHDTQ